MSGYVTDCVDSRLTRAQTAPDLRELPRKPGQLGPFSRKMIIRGPRRALQRSRGMADLREQIDMTHVTPACARPTKKYPEGRTGTPAGYGAHRGAGEEACAACVAAHSGNLKARRLRLAAQGVDVNVSNRKYYAANREALNEQRRVAYREDPAKSMARTRAWALENPEKTKEIARRYETANRAARREQHREWASKNPEKAKAARVNKAAVIREAKDRPCSDCGIQYPYYVMQFDHRDPTKKLFTIGNRGALKTLEVLNAEIAKCDVVCANCHMERTHGPTGRQRRQDAERA